jgi:uncharacterized protein YlxW (UPF0749 family)
LKKLSSQIIVGIVCCILGFILTYQFRQVNRNERNDQPVINTSDITAQIQKLTKQKQDLQGKLDDLESKIKKYETDTAVTDTTKELLKELNESRIINGMVDVKGPGVIIEITPQSNIFNNNTEPSINPLNLSVLINNLLASEAEAISVNDIRITSRTGIAQSGNFIEINNTNIPTDKKVTIKVIGDKKKINYSLDFLDILGEFKNCTSKSSTSDDITIHKYEGEFKFKFVKPVEN